MGARLVFALSVCADLAGANIGGKSDGKYKSFRNLDCKLRACDFAGVTNFELQDIPDEFVRDKDDWNKGQYMDVTYRTGDSKYLVCCVRESLVRDRMDEFLDMAKQACQFLHPQYGIVYRRPFGSGPSAYAFCLGFGPRLHSFDDNMTPWSFLMDHEAFVFLRNIYPWSILTQTQLDLRVGKERLKDWILKKPYRGGLSPFTDRMTLWTVPNESIPKLRDELWGAGLILDEKRDFDSKWFEYNVSQDDIAESYKTGIPLALTHQLRSGQGTSEQEMLQNVLGAFGTPESQVLKVEKPGELRELSKTELEKAKQKVKPKKGPSADG